MSFGEPRRDAHADAPADVRPRRRFRAPLKLLVPTIAALGAGGAIAVAAIPGSDGMIHGCYLTSSFTGGPTLGTLRVLDPSVPGDESCDPESEQTVNWNQQGPPGVTGPQGPTGPTGSPGQPGANGANGAAGAAGPAGSVTVQSGHGSDIFMYLSPPGDLGQLDPVREVTLGGDKQAFELDSFSFDTSNTGTIGSATAGAGAGKVHFEKFEFAKPLDRYSSTLFKDLAAGTVLKSLEIVVRQPSGTGKLSPTVQYVLKDVLLTNLHVAANSRAPSETVQGEYGAIQFVVYEQTKTGQTKVGSSGGWSQVTNQPVTVPGLLRRR